MRSACITQYMVEQAQKTKRFIYEQKKEIFLRTTLCNAFKPIRFIIAPVRYFTSHFLIGFRL